MQKVDFESCQELGDKDSGSLSLNIKHEKKTFRNYITSHLNLK